MGQKGRKHSWEDGDYTIWNLTDQFKFIQALTICCFVTDG